MPYCKTYDKKEDVDCVKCHKENKLPKWYCCLDECGEHGFCKDCKATNNQVTK